jgi:hypothetical protein
MPAPAKTFKRTTIYISLGEDTKVYDSPESIPHDLRKQLMRSTRGMNSATILIADRGGRREIQKVLEGQPSSLDGSLRSAHFQPKGTPGDAVPAKLGAAAQLGLAAAAGAVEGVGKRARNEAPGLSFWQRAAELSLPAALGIALWLLFTLK